jgi:hypothetical protein
VPYDEGGVGEESGGEEHANDEESSCFRFFQDRYCGPDDRETTCRLAAMSSLS